MYNTDFQVNQYELNMQMNKQSICKCNFIANQYAGRHTLPRCQLMKLIGQNGAVMSRENRLDRQRAPTLGQGVYILT